MNSQQSSKWEQALNLYEEGASDVEIAKLLGITKKDFEKMYSEVATFSAFVDKGRTLAEAWWNYKLRKNVDNKDFNTTLFNFAMKNRWNWADKVDTTTNSQEDLGNIEQMREEFRRLAKKLEEKEPGLVRQLAVVQGGKGE